MHGKRMQLGTAKPRAKRGKALWNLGQPEMAPDEEGWRQLTHASRMYLRWDVGIGEGGVTKWPTRHQLSRQGSPAKPSWVEEDTALFFHLAGIVPANSSTQLLLLPERQELNLYIPNTSHPNPTLLSMNDFVVSVKQHFPKAIFPSVAEEQQLAAGCHEEPQKTNCPEWFRLSPPSSLYFKVRCPQKSLPAVRV